MIREIPNSAHPDSHRTISRVVMAAILAAALASVGDAPGKATITTEEGFRIIRSDGLPDHPTGEFPNRENPNRISEQRYVFRVPEKPAAAETTTALGMWPFGVALNGVPFDPGAAEWWQRNPASGWQYEAMAGGVRLGIDEHHAHVQPGGAYHYHGVPTGLLDGPNGDSAPTLVGYAADGFPIYGPFHYKSPDNPKSEVVKLRSSYAIRKGERADGPGGAYDGSFVRDYEYVAGSGDLDECNGRFGKTSEYPEGTYYYVLTDTFPFIPRHLRGTPDESFKTRGGSRGPRPPHGMGPPPMGGHPQFGRVEGLERFDGPPGMPPFPPPDGFRPDAQGNGLMAHAGGRGRGPRGRRHPGPPVQMTSDDMDHAPPDDGPPPEHPPDPCAECPPCDRP